MNPAASKLFAEGYIAGFMDMATTMMGAKAPYAVKAVATVAEVDLPGALAGLGAVLQAKAQGGGAVALLLPANAAYAIYARVMETETPSGDVLDTAHLADLTDVFSPFMGAGVSFFKEKYGQITVQEEIRALPGGVNAARGLVALLGTAIIGAPFEFTLPGGERNEGMFLFSQSLERVIPAAAVAKENAMDRKGQTKDILRSVGMPEPESREAPANLDMVLDIGLVVKARLGQVLMPVAEILALGPGSIIEVGHLVDEPIDLLVNDKLVARGDVVVVDEKFGLRITEIISQKDRIESLR